MQSYMYVLFTFVGLTLNSNQMKKLMIVLFAGLTMSCSSDEGNEPVTENPSENPIGNRKYFKWQGDAQNQYTVIKETTNGEIYFFDQASLVEVTTGDKVSVVCKIDADSGMHGNYFFTNNELEVITSGSLHSVIPPSNYPYLGMVYILRCMADNNGELIFTAP